MHDTAQVSIRRRACAYGRGAKVQSCTLPRSRIGERQMTDMTGRTINGIRVRA